MSVRRRVSTAWLYPWIKQVKTSGGDATAAVGRTAVVVLNQPLDEAEFRAMAALWRVADFRVCADGGANRLFDASKRFDATVTNKSGGDADKKPGREAAGAGSGEGSGVARAREMAPPDLVTGDLDSLRDDVRAQLEGVGVPVVKDPDQDSHDLDKALAAVVKRQGEVEGRQVSFAL